MKRFGVWVYLMSKRLLKRPSFVIILALLPVVLLMYRIVVSEDDGSLPAAIYIEGEGDALTESFLADATASSGVVRFYEVGTESELYDDVVAGRAECGYILHASLLERLLDKDWHGCITTVVASNSQYAAFVNEWVYAMLFRNLECDLVTNYVVNKSGLRLESVAEAERRLRTHFDLAMSEVAVFEYVYLDFYDNTVVEKPEEVESHLTRPIRGTVALFVFLAGLAGLVFWFQDDAEGRFRVMAYNRRPGISFGSLLLPTLLAGVVGLVCLFVSGITVGFFREVTAMLCYVFLISGFCNLVRHLVPSVNVVCAAIPVLAVASYLCCPVIMDLRPMLPVIEYIRKLLAPDYYLQTFAGQPMWILFVSTVVITLVSLLLPEKY